MNLDFNDMLSVLNKSVIRKIVTFLSIILVYYTRKNYHYSFLASYFWCNTKTTLFYDLFYFCRF